MIAAFAGGWPVKKSATTSVVAVKARIMSTWLIRSRGGRACWTSPRSSLRCSTASSATVRSSPTSATGARAAANCGYGICEKLPIIIFCGLPVIVAVEPTFDAIATASRYGTGLRFWPKVSSSTNGAITRQIASFTRNAENVPETATMAASNSNGRCTRRATQALTNAKKPEIRRFATTIIMPSSRVMVCRSTAW